VRELVFDAVLAEALARPFSAVPMPVMLAMP
jgi:hypothetical protein